MRRTLSTTSVLPRPCAADRSDVLSQALDDEHAACPYLNFTASHDGIGMRRAEELLSEQEQAQIVDAVIRFGGRVSTRRSTDGGECVYQIDRDKDEKIVEAEYV